MAETAEDLSVAVSDRPQDRGQPGLLKSAFGQLTLLFIGLLLYAALLGAASRLLYPATSLDDAVEALFADLSLHLGQGMAYLALALPLALILILNGYPAIRTWWVDRHQRRVARSDAPSPPPGYFRLAPYGTDDATHYQRLDGTHERIQHFVKTSNRALLYLTGASGVGKSSLVDAALLPALETEGWQTLRVRAFDDPLQRLRSRLLDTSSLFDDTQLADAPLRDLLDEAATTAMQAGVKRTLIVIDQFEEFLLLATDPSRKADAVSFFRRFDEHPVSGVSFLIVCRSDYRPLLFQEGFPTLSAFDNWEEIGGYKAAHALAFLQPGLAGLSDAQAKAILHRLDKIESTAAIYRPMTLNLSGLTLERTGKKHLGDASRLLERHLSAALSTSALRDEALPVLKCMVSNAGTRRPQSANEIAAATRLETWRVQAILHDLERHQLVHTPGEFPQRWEVTHNTVAQLIDETPVRSRSAVWQAVRLALVPVVLAVLVGGLVFAGPVWLKDKARRQLATLPVVVEQVGNRSAIHLSFPNTVQDADLEQALAPASRLGPIENLSLREAESITAIQPLAMLTHLKALDLSKTPIADLAPLAELGTLEALDISWTPALDLAPLSGLDNLHSLVATGTPVDDIEPLASLSALTTLNLSWTPVGTLTPLTSLHRLAVLDISATAVENLEPLSLLDNLATLDASSTAVNDLTPLAGLDMLTTLGLSRSRVTDLAPLSALNRLTVLGLSNTRVNDLQPLSGLTSLTTVDLSSTRVTDLGPLSALSKLETLDLSNTRTSDLTPLSGLARLNSLRLANTGVKDLKPLTGLSELTVLDLSSTRARNLAPLAGLTTLARLYLYDTPELKDLSPLKPLLPNLRIEGATPEQLETLEQSPAPVAQGSTNQPVPLRLHP